MTTHHEDFRLACGKAFGAAHVLFFGARPAPHQREFTAYATDWRKLVKFVTPYGQPEGWGDGIALSRIDLLKWKWEKREIRTTHYEDFRAIVGQAFSTGRVVFYGTRGELQNNEFLIDASDWEWVVRFTGSLGQPETFNQNFPDAVELKDIDEVRWDFS